MSESRFLAEFEYEVLVGSHPADDLEVDGVCWVSSFCRDLKNRLRQTFKGDSDLRFHRLGENDDSVADARDRILRDSATLVAVLGPKFRNPVIEFGDHWARFATVIDHSYSRTRLFKAYKIDCDYKGPDSEGAGFTFWSHDHRRGIPIEFLYQGSPKAKDDHRLELFKLASDIHETLNCMKGMEDNRPRVYLTGNSPKLTGFYEDVLAFLSSWCKVREEPRIDPDLPAFEKAVREELERCALSVHLFDRSLPLFYDDHTRSGLQVKIAQELVKKRKLAAIAWSPEIVSALDTTFVSGALREFLPENFDCLCNETMMGLRARIRARLSQPLAAGDRLRIFVIAHQQDRALIREMLDSLEKDGEYKIQLSPDFDPATYLVEDYRGFLNESDAAVICRADAPLSWFTRMHDTLLAHLGQSCNMSLRQCAIYDARPQAAFGTPFTRIEAASFDAGQLGPFLTSLRTPNPKGPSS